MDKTIIKIALTGGPCAGKSTSLSWVMENLTKKGWKVFIVSETATDMINGNAKPWEINSVRFQVSLYEILKAKEYAYENIAKNSDFDKVLIVCDRGALDAEAYLDEDACRKWHKILNKTATEMMAEYDAVFHLVTAAKGAEEFYTKANNGARMESVLEAVDADARTLKAWTGHPHLRIIDNSTDFNGKMMRLVKEISAFLGEPEPFEVERKFLIGYPDINLLEDLPNCKKVEILQTYLKNDGDDEVRVRQRGDGKTFQFTKTTKRKISNIKRAEIEKIISMQEYCQELMNADTNLKQIRKTRYCLTHGKTYFEIDIYPFWDDKAILEVELIDENEDFEIPEFLHIIKEVTDHEFYKNKNLAKNF